MAVAKRESGGVIAMYKCRELPNHAAKERHSLELCTLKHAAITIGSVNQHTPAAVHHATHHWAKLVGLPPRYG